MSIWKSPVPAMSTLRILRIAVCLMLMAGYAKAERAWDKQFDSTPITFAIVKNYVAYLTCGMGSRHLSILACFASGSYGGVGTDLELTNGDEYGLYKAYNIRSLGQENREKGLEIRLKEPFEIRAQNAHGTLILGLTIVEASTGKTVYRKQVSQFGVINVSSGD